MTVTVGKLSRRQMGQEASERTAATEAFEPAIKSGLTKAFGLLAAEIGSAAFLSAVAEGDPEKAMQQFAVVEARQQIVDALREVYQAALRRSGQVMDGQTLATSHQFSFDANNWRVLRIAEQRTANLVTQITEETRKALRATVRDAIDEGLNPRVAARRIRPQVGLIDRHAASVRRLHARLIEEGVKRTVADRQAAAKARQLLKWRTENIARTEMLWTSNMAQKEQWRQMQNLGLLPRTGVQIIWTVQDDDRLCQYCAPMEGVVVDSVETQFESTLQGSPGQETKPRKESVFVDHPPLHPSCRCSLSMQPDESFGPATNQAAADDLIARAKGVEPDISRFMQGQARAQGARLEGFEFRFKGRDSMIRKLGKLSDEAGGKLRPAQLQEQINDALRYTMVVDDAGYAKAAKGAIAAAEDDGWKLLDSKKYWTEGGQYKGINSVLETPTGMKVELQFHTPSSIDVKENVLHPLYEEFRKLPKGSAAALELDAAMTEAAAQIPVPDGLDAIPGRFKAMWLVPAEGTRRTSDPSATVEPGAGSGRLRRLLRRSR